MSVPGNGSEQSMEEILASIRNLISQEGALPGSTGAPAPVMPQPVPEQQASGPAADAARPDEKPQAPLPGDTPGLIRADSSASAPSPAPFPAAASAVSRHDDDDLADLLDDPLNPADLRPAVAEEPAAAASPVVSARKPEADVPAAPAAATGMSFDFGSLVPNREAGTHREGGAQIPGQSRTHETALGTGLAAPVKPTADGPSLGWPASMRSGHTGLSSDTAANSASKQENAPAGLDRTESEVRPNPGTPMNAGPSGRVEGALAHSGTEPTPSPAVGGFASTPTGEVQKAALAPGTDSSPKIPRGSSERQAPAVTRGPEAVSPAARSEADAPAAFPSIEPVLKAFERSVPGPAASGQKSAQSAAPRAKVEFGSKMSSSGFGPAGAGEPRAAQDPAPASTPSAPSPAPAAVAKAAANATSGQPITGSRTLEDAVMELLRPMLREWLDDNLPRIIEAAVQREVADAIRSKVDPA